MQHVYIDLYLEMSLSSCLSVIVVTSLVLSAWMGVANAQIASNTPADWRENLCDAKPTHVTRDGFDDVMQVDPPDNPLESLHLGQVGHDYIIGGPSTDIIISGLGDGCYQGDDDIDKITLVSQKSDTKYVIDDDEGIDVIKCIGKPLQLIIDISETVRRLRPDIIGCPTPIMVDGRN